MRHATKLSHQAQSVCEGNSRMTVYTHGIGGMPDKWGLPHEYGDALKTAKGFRRNSAVSDSAPG